MCDGVYRKLQEYYRDQEEKLIELAVDLIDASWFALVRWHQGKLQLVVRSPGSMRKWHQEKLEGLV